MAPLYQLINVATSEVIVAKLELADTFWRRFRGLQFRRALADDEGLLITPCRSIHTHWMRFAIDVAMLDKKGVVLATRSNVEPWRMVHGPKGTQAILEMAVGAITKSTAEGAELAIVCQGDSPLSEPWPTTGV
jgi:uncharacterized membrane protein (UPF0127 family)